MGRVAHKGPVFGSLAPHVAVDAGHAAAVGADDFTSDTGNPAFAINYYRDAILGPTSFREFYPGAVYGHAWSIKGVVAGTPDLDFKTVGAKGASISLLDAVISNPGANSCGYGVCAKVADHAEGADLDLDSGGSAPAKSALGAGLQAGTFTLCAFNPINAGTEGFTGCFHLMLNRPWWLPFDAVPSITVNGVSGSGTSLSNNFETYHRRKFGGARVQGDFRGYMTVVPLPTVAATPASGTNDVNHRFKMPFGGRLMGIIYNYVSSAAGNSINVYNQTQAQSILGATSAVSATVAAGRVDATGLVAAGRDLAVDDIIQIRSTTAGTAITGLSVSLVIVPRTVPTRAIERAFAVQDENNLLPFRTSTSRDAFKVGGFANLHCGSVTSSASATSEQLRLVRAPFNCVPDLATFCKTAGAAGNIVDIRNITQGYTVCTWTDSAGGEGAEWVVAANMDRRQINRDDLLAYRSTTTGTATSNLIANFYVHSVGFPHDDPAND